LVKQQTTFNGKKSGSIEYDDEMIFLNKDKISEFDGFEECKVFKTSSKKTRDLDSYNEEYPT
jgi:hypothetical protein